MDVPTRDEARRRGHGRCEYCGLPQSCVAFAFQIEHIIAKQHGDSDHLDSLALACDRCNAYKGTNLSAIDPATGNIVLVFHPRRDRAIQAAVIVGLTDIGRATVRLLNMNARYRYGLRKEIGDAAIPPP